MKNNFENQIKNARRWVIGGGVFNSVASFPLAMPFLYKWYINLFNKLNSMFGLGGADWIHPTNAGNMLFLNTAGLALFLVGILLLYSARNIADRMGIALLNGIVRFIWALTAIYYLVNYDFINILYVLVIIDLVFASVFLYYYIVLKRMKK